MNAELDENVQDLRLELEEMAGNGSEVWWRQERARQWRFNEWEGQSPDGRKHGDALDGDALPFEGAPDNRIPLVDSAVNEKVRLLKRGFFRAQIQAKPIEPNDAARAQNINTLLTWLRDSAMRDELRTEVELSAQYLMGDDPGVTVLEVQWLRDITLKLEPLSLDQLAMMFATGGKSPEEAQDLAQQNSSVEPELLAEFQDLATNKDRLKEWMQWLQAMFPGATPQALKAAAKALRKDGQADLPVPSIRENRPSVRALKLYDEVFFPIGTADIQRARSIHRREWLTEVELRERVHTLGWNADMVEKIIERGKGQSLLSYPLRWRQWAAYNVTLAGPGRAVNERDNLFEIWWSYRREADELGVPGISCTVWNCVAMEQPLKETMADYPHGKYPFVLGTRERLGRQTTDSRGLGVPLATHQNEIKVQRDARGAHVQLLASPPMKTRMAAGAYELVIGPNAQLPVQNMQDLEPLTLPNFMQNSVEMELTTRTEADHYAGLMRVDAEQNRVALIQQDEVDNFLALWQAVFSQVLSLSQSYFSEAELARITGQEDMPLRMKPDDIVGGFDVTLEIDARDLNMEFVIKKMDMFGKLRAQDSAGRLDNAAFIEWAAAAVDPILARRTVQPMSVVSKKMIDDERSNVTNMALGVEPVMDPDGTTNPEFRLKVVAQTIAQSPKLAQLFGGDEIFRGLVENYQKYLVQQINQEQNKVIGRLGTQPTQGVPGLYQGGSALGAG